jgi:hypothetical protein
LFCNSSRGALRQVSNSKLINMKKLTLIVLMLVSALFYNANAQEAAINEKLTDVNEKVNGLIERVATAESDLSKLTKIKVSGYLQAQYMNYESKLVQPDNYFMVRRARVKFTYEAADGIKFVLQPDFAPGSLSIKDAYVVVNDHWTKAFSIWAGKFNRPNYEVEYSSSQREVAERSLLIRTLYPGERAIGAKLEFNPLTIPLHIQLAILNGADGLTINNVSGTNLNSTENADFDNYKDIMVRAYYNLSLGNFGGLDFGAHGYFGSLKSNTTETLSSDYQTVKSVSLGDGVKRNWLGCEFQLFADILGGLSVKGEYIGGKNASIGYVTSGSTIGSPNYQNKFSGYYIYLIKNLGKKNQFAMRFDRFDPNTDIKGKDITASLKYTDSNYSRSFSKNDLATNTLSLALHHYFDDNIRITLNYDIVKNEKVGASGVITSSYTNPDGTTGKVDYNSAINQNVLTLRIQAKF